MMKTIKMIILTAFVSILGVCMTSCGGYSNGKAKEIILKNDDDKLKKDDYSQMLEWYEEYGNKYFDKWENIVEKSDGYMEYRCAMTEFEADIISDYPFMGSVREILNTADEEDMGSSNHKKLEKLNEKYEKRAEKFQKKIEKMNEKYMKKKNKDKDYDE